MLWEALLSKTDININLFLGDTLLSNYLSCYGSKIGDDNAKGLIINLESFAF